MFYCFVKICSRLNSSKLAYYVASNHVHVLLPENCRVQIKRNRVPLVSTSSLRIDDFLSTVCQRSWQGYKRPDLANPVPASGYTLSHGM